MQKQLRAFAAAFAKFGHVEDDAADADGDADAPDHARPLSDGRLRGAWLRGASAASRARLLSSSEGDWAFDDRVARQMENLGIAPPGSADEVAALALYRREQKRAAVMQPPGPGAWGTKPSVVPQQVWRSTPAPAAPLPTPLSSWRATP